MIGPHDLGGTAGHGPVVVEKDEPVFHAPWEGKMFALNMLAGTWTTPEFRAVVEQMPPAEYLATSYYEHWLFQFERYCEQQGWCSSENLGQRATSVGPASASPAEKSAMRAEQVMPMLLEGGVNRAGIASAPRFAVGDRVRMRRDNPPTHTRLPNYVRGCAGTVTAAHGGFAFADARAQHRHDIAEHLYTIRFEAAEVWGRDAEANCAIYLDLHESYMGKA
jgi:nitrile hydratase subunit beta